MSIGVIQKYICRLPYKNLFLALRYSTGDGEFKAEALRLANCLVNVRAIIQHFSPKIEAWLASQNLSTPTEDQVILNKNNKLKFYSLKILNQYVIILIKSNTYFVRLIIQYLRAI